MFGFYFLINTTFAQELPSSAEQQIEAITDVMETETEDDSFLQNIEHYRKHPLNLNEAEANELQELKLLSDLQIESLLRYRRLFGNLVHIYELQAIPAWDIPTIRKVLPFVKVGFQTNLKESLMTRIKGGEHQLLLRISQTMEPSKGFIHDSSGSKYLGSPQRIFFRYRYAYKNLLRFGMTGDKDAGEQFFKGVQRAGFDFYSFHFFAGKLGLVEALALGDFTVNLGQGLIHWQGMAFKKGAEVTNIKRQAAVLKPYSSAGEFLFHRGIGITMKKNNTEASAFCSFRKLNANLSEEEGPGQSPVSSLLTSGNNRTVQEINDRHALEQFTAGGNVRWKKTNGFLEGLQLAFNAVFYKLSSPLSKRDWPYNLYSIKGNKWYNLSMDYSFNARNIHFFGEFAVDKKLNRAMVNGMLMSIDQRIDFSLVHRAIAKEYQAMYGNAFTEVSVPNNEQGLFAGLTIRPNASVKINVYADVYTFAWLRYRVDAPSGGKDFLIQFNFAPSRHFDWYTRYKTEWKQQNRPQETDITHHVIPVTRRSWRTHFNCKLNQDFVVRSRVELSWYKAYIAPAEKGFLWLVDVLYKPMMKPYNGSVRLQYFETEGYNSRLYAYENDVMYSYSVPVSSGRGLRYYLNISYDVNKKITMWFRYAKSVFPGQSNIGTGEDEIRGNKKTEWKVQARVLF